MKAKTTQTDKGRQLREEGQRWISRIKEAEKLEDRWLKNADEAVKAFASEGDRVQSEEFSANYDFNILFSNVETIVPAIINSPPLPDIRRRFGDEDPVAKDFAQIIERAIRVQVDDSLLQIELEATAQDAFLAGRGITRLRFKSDISGEVDREEIRQEAIEDADIQLAGADGDTQGDEYSGAAGEGAVQAAAEQVTNERITFEAVSWRDYRHGPAKRWEDRKWDAFRHAMAVEDIDPFQDMEMVAGQLSEQDKTAKGESDDDIVVWEVWCRKTRKVKFISEATGVILKIVDDPLGLSQFFPIATPVQPVEITGRLMPVNPFSVYRNLAEELDTITKRINVLVDAMRVKGWYSGDATDLENVLSLTDNEFAPITNAEAWAQHGGLEKAIAFWPIDRFAVVIKELYAAREQVKQAIYEITGISDIVRGATKASETLGAQQIKTQWGSLRIQKAQRAMERAARDLFVMMSEIIPAQFTSETLQKMTGVQIIPTQQDLMPLQPPQLPPEAANDPKAEQQARQKYEAAEKARMEKLQHLEALNTMFKERVSSFYRVDVETDSTIRADMTQQKQEVAEFLTGSATYFQAVGPLVAEGALPAEIALEIYASNARMFNLGKTVEDAIEDMLKRVKDQSGQQQQKPDPEAIKAQTEKAKAEADMQAKQMDAQMASEKHQQEMDMATMSFQQKMQELQATAEIEGRKRIAELAIAEMGKSIKEIDLQIKDKDLQIKTKMANAPAKEKAA